MIEGLGRSSETGDATEPPKSLGSVMFSSPCFFCPRLETCGEDEAINYRNCQRLDEFISK
jgi:hypothetical protein